MRGASSILRAVVFNVPIAAAYFAKHLERRGRTEGSAMFQLIRCCRSRPSSTWRRRIQLDAMANRVCQFLGREIRLPDYIEGVGQARSGLPDSLPQMTPVPPTDLRAHKCACYERGEQPARRIGDPLGPTWRRSARSSQVHPDEDTQPPGIKKRRSGDRAETPSPRTFRPTA